MLNIKFKKRIRLKAFAYKGCHRYALTFCTNNKASYFADIDTVRKVMDFLQSEAIKQRFKIWSCCFMPDHLHILIEGESSLSGMKMFVSVFKQKSGYWFSQTHEKDLWQTNYYEHVLRSDEVTEKAANYILDNPVRKGLVKDYSEYPFSWCKINNFIGKGFVKESVGQGFSLAKTHQKATLKGCPTTTKEKRNCRARLQPCKDLSKSNLKRLPYNNQKGFTLIEVIMVIILISIIASVAAMIILEGAKSYQKEVSYSDIQNQGRLAIERMAREIRMIRSCNDISAPLTNPDTDLQFVDVSGNTIRFLFSPPNLQRSENGGALQTLASNINSGSFNYYDKNNGSTTSCTSPNDVWYIQIDLTTVNAGETLVMRLRVHPRNF